MSFSVSLTDRRLEWAGSGLNTVFTQRRNLLRPAFLRMLADILRFNRTATALALAGKDAQLAEPVSRFLEREKFSTVFRDWYLLPMIGAIWSCSTPQMMAFPVGTLIRFCHNHGLLQVNDWPQWHTVNGSAREYVRRMLPAIGDTRVGAPVTSVRRSVHGVEIDSTRGTEHFDHVVLACHSDQALALLADPSHDVGHAQRDRLRAESCGVAYRHFAVAGTARMVGMELRKPHRRVGRRTAVMPTLPHQQATTVAVQDAGDRLSESGT